MSEITIYKEEYINLFLPNDGVEFLFNIINDGLGIEVNSPLSLENREKTLMVIKELLKLKLIYVSSWCRSQRFIKKKTLSVGETMDILDNIWFKEAKYPDYYDMVKFRHKDWYVQKLEELGFDHFTDWKWFVKNKIGNLENWIEENRPKDV